MLFNFVVIIIFFFCRREGRLVLHGETTSINLSCQQEVWLWTRSDCHNGWWWCLIKQWPKCLLRSSKWWTGMIGTILVWPWSPFWGVIFSLFIFPFSWLFLAPPPLSWCGGLESNVDFLFLFWGQLTPRASRSSWKSIHQLVSWWGLWGSGRGRLEPGSQGEALLQITLWHPQKFLNLISICYHCPFLYECQHFWSPV